MNITHTSRRESRVTAPLRHIGRHTAPTRPDPTRPISRVTFQVQEQSVRACGDWFWR